MGISVTRYRYAHVLAGGALAGIGGACYSLAITPGWTDGDSLVGGAGWIAIALVIFSFWRPELCLVGAYLFGGALRRPAVRAPGAPLRGIPRSHAGVPERAAVRDATIVVLVVVSTGLARRRLGAPAALGVPYVREER